jgi:serine/threonine protein kinase
MTRSGRQFESLRAGDSFGPYEIESPLGEGAVGVVLRARRATDGEIVALKILREELAQDETFKRRFAHEVRAASEATSKHLVAILDSGEVEGHPYLAMAYVPGPSLEERLEQEGPLSLDEVTRTVSEVGTALDTLHRAEIVHRDVKPSNVLFGAEGSALLTDFGLAKGRAYTLLTRPGQAMGTLDYMAPELIRGRPASPATDVYSLGCVTYECITGAPPFADRSVFEIGTAHLEEEPPDLTSVRPEATASLHWTVTRALAKEPDDRPPTATAYAHMLRLAVR